MTERANRAAGAADPSRAALAQARRTTRAVADDLLTHLPDVGDPAAQRLLDAWVEQASDTARALSEALEERLLERPPQARSAGADDPAAERSALGAARRPS